jgi:16S rRNA (cytidine1402-2'-O)-methyltransferase
MSVWRGPSKEVQAIDLMGPLLEGRDMGLMSEAGLPAIADPGTEIVAMAHHLQIPVRPLTGPNSLMLALMASGMSGQHFCFHGYLPIKSPDRLKKLRSMENESKQNHSAHLWIETPYRNLSMLTGLTEALAPNTTLCMAMDLTLETEQIIRLPVSSWQKLLQSDVSTLIKNIDKRPAVFVMQA